jgi:predicted dehydrogenase
VTTVSASTYDLLGRAGFGSDPKSTKIAPDDAKTFDVEDLASAFMRLDDGGTLLVEAGWAAHRRDDVEFGITLYGTEGGAELIVTDMEPIGKLRMFTDEAGVAAETRLHPPAGLGHDAVVERFLDTVRNGGGDRGAAAAQLARVLDACYASAAERREVTLA